MSLASFLATLLALQPLLATAQASSDPIRLPEATPVIIHPLHDLRSDKQKTGDAVQFLVEQDVVMNGVTLIRRGAIAEGTVTKARHARSFGQNGVLQLAIRTVQAVDGSTVPLRASAEHKGGDNTALSVGLAVLVSVFAVFIQGREAVIKADKQITVYVDRECQFAVSGDVPRQQSAPVATQVTPPRPPRVDASPPAPQGDPPAADTTEIRKHLVCKRVDDQGAAVGSATAFPSRMAGILSWFQVTPASGDRVYEVQWYRDDQQVATTAAIVKARARAGWSSTADASLALAPGAWKVVLLRAGQVKSTQYFTITP